MIEKPEVGKEYYWEYKGHWKAVRITEVYPYPDSEGGYMVSCSITRSTYRGEKGYTFSTLSTCLSDLEDKLLELAL